MSVNKNVTVPDGNSFTLTPSTASSLHASQPDKPDDRHLPQPESQGARARIRAVLGGPPSRFGECSGRRSVLGWSRIGSPVSFEHETDASRDVETPSGGRDARQGGAGERDGIVEARGSIGERAGIAQVRGRRACPGGAGSREYEGRDAVAVRVACSF